LGWNLKNPLKHAAGQVFAQHEANYDPWLSSLLGGTKPEFLVKITDEVYWAIEAKSEHKQLTLAVDEAKNFYADKINQSNQIKCLFATGVAGHEDSTFLVETYFFDGVSWRQVEINSAVTTGFISREQVLQIIQANDPNLKDQEIHDELFIQKANEINELLHRGAINKRNRARVIASLLLALAKDSYLPISDDPTTLNEDINSRVRSLLRSFNKENFAQEIAINLPTSKDNHLKNRRALVNVIQQLRSINIRSAINSGSDLLGQFYEIFLKYANDAKEIGIVLTPRHITRFAAEVINFTYKDFILDVTCGTGGFLVAALDRVKKTSPTLVDTFKASHVFGTEQDPEVVGLALVNMIFRGDGKSHIYEGNALDNYFFKVGDKVKKIKRTVFLKQNETVYERVITRTLMNPPFALEEQEYAFVDHALSQMADGGLLFAILPVSTMSSTSDSRGEITWRQNLLKRHRLKAVIKLSEDLFQPNAHKGTYAVIIEAWNPHGDAEVFWAIMDDGYTMKKSKRLPSDNVPSNMPLITEELRALLLLEKEPAQIDKLIGYKKINLDDPTLDCGAEAYLDCKVEQEIDISTTTNNLFNVLLHKAKPEKLDLRPGEYKLVNMADILNSITRGDCVPLNQLKPGDIPVITTTEKNNGVGGFYSTGSARIFRDAITIPANGSKYQAFFHPYEFTATPDVLVCELKPIFSEIEVQLYICSAINRSSWRFS
jgi:type I restriction-modification system DNA methylase subunit